MSSAFISYSSQDEDLARGLYNATTMAGIETFLASISLDPGCKWTDSIFQELEQATWIFFLASKNSCSSAAVQQEIGASLMQKKTIIPLLIDIKPEELPGWVGNHQAIDIRSSPQLLHNAISKIADENKVDTFWAGVIVGAIVVGLFVLLTTSKG